MDILVNVANQKLKIATNLKSLVAGTQEFVRFTFNLTGDWDDLLTFAQFRQNGIAYNAYLDENNSAYLPSEIGVGTCTLMLYGSNDKTIATTNYLTLSIDENILVSDANSTEISESLYTQLVTKVNTLLTWNEQNAASLQAVDKDLQIQINKKAAQTALDAEISRAKAAEKVNADAIALKASQAEVDELTIKVTRLESNEVIASLIEAAVIREIEEYLESGTLANLTITNGSITRNKVNSEFNDILTLAETAMQPSTYDRLGRKVDIFDYAQSRADTVQNNLNKVKEEIQGAYVLTDDIYYTNLGDALRGAVTLSRSYAQALLSDYKAFTIEFVDELPLVGESMVFYLIPKKSGNGYDKYWWIVDENGDAKWDMFGGTSTLVVAELPYEGEEDIDYILKSSAGCLYYKWIDGYWEVVAGSIASVVSELPETGNEFTDYYLLNESGSYIHHRYINGRFHTIGSNAYTRDEINEKLALIKEQMASLQNAINNNKQNIETNTSNISAVSRSVDALRQEMNNLDIEGYSYYASYGKATLATGDEADNVFTLYEVKDDIEQVKSQFVISGGGGGGSTVTTNLVVERVTASPIIITTTDKVEISFNFSSTDADGEEIDGTYTWKLGNTVISTGTLIQGINTFDMTEHVNIGTQKFTLTVVDAGGSVVVKSWTVQLVDVRIDSTFSDRITYPIGNNVNFTYTPYGAVSKTVHFILDGVELTPVVTSSSGTLQSYSLPAQSHGSHLLECYITATVNNMEIETEHIYKDIIWYDETSKVPIIGCIYRYDHYGTVPAKQYNTTSIPIYVFDPNTSTPAITKSVDGDVVATQVLTTINDTWAYKTSEIGEHTLIISCGETSVTIVMDIEELGIDVSPITANLAFDFNPTGLSNSSENRLWKDANADVNMSVSDNFDWSNGGYQLDSDGNQYFCVKAGTTATINYNLFARDASLYGSEFKLIFKTTNVKKADATFLSCQADSTVVGLQMDVHSAYLKSSVNSLYIPYCEEDIIEFEFNINALNTEDTDATAIIMSYEDGVGLRPMLYDSTHRLFQYSPVPITIGSPYCDVHIYRMKAYSSALTDSNILSNFIADARDSDTMIDRYNRNQIYNENNTLTPDSVANACPNLKIIKIECPHFTNDKKDYVKNTTIECIHKGGDPVLDNWKFLNAYHSGQGTTSNEYGYAGRNIDIIMCADGINQINDKIPLDTSYITELILGDGTKYSDGSGKVSLTRNSVPNNWFNIKVNIASSENANNALLAKRYNDYLPYTSVAKSKNGNAKNTMEFVNCIIFIRETDPDITQHREFQDTDWHYYALGNIGDSKNTDKTRVADANDPKEFVVEIADNTLPNSVFDTGVFDENGKMVFPISKSQWVAGNEKYDSLHTAWGDTYEFRYEMDGISDEQNAANIKVWNDFYEWVITSTDEEFVNELENWFIKDSALYFYLFTERYTMIDNRAKNTFWHFSKVYITKEEATTMGENAKYYTIDDDLAAINEGYRFEMWDYDNDTALGINNSGELTMTYGKEDVDYKTDGDPNSGYIFNAAESVFWRRIRNLMYNDLANQYQILDSSGCWSSDSLINQWDNWQSQFPEEIWRIDIDRKYYRTYQGGGLNGGATPEPTNRFLKEMMNGRKKYQRRQFERDQSAYMGTKYLCTTIKADQIMFRCNTPQEAVVAPDYTLRIVPYSDMYLSVLFGNSTSAAQVRAKAGETYEIQCPFTTMDDTAVLIYCASRIQALNDISACYIHDNDFSKASKLQKLIIGSDKDGYSNSFLTTLNLGNNALLEELDIRNCPNLTGSINLSSCNNLEKLYAEGTSITSVLFATNGKISVAYLPDTINSLTMRNLNYLTDLKVNYDNLESLTEENSIVDEYGIVVDAIDTLQTLRLVGIDWILSDTTLLNNILNMNNTMLSGKVYISGQIRNQELLNYANAWSDLEVTYNSDNLVTQYLVTYVNADDKNTVLFTTYVDRGSTPPDPYAEGFISIPTLESDTQYTYEFGTFTDGEYVSGSGWNNITDAVLGNRIITAVYTKTVRKYKVTWYSRAGLSLGSVETEYGSEVVYNGETPTNTSEENVYIYNVFAGWNKSTGHITEDTDVYAIWEKAALPATPENGGKSLEDMTVGEIFAITTSGNTNNYFEQKDHYDITLGHDFDFENVESELLAEDLYLDGATAKNTGIQLFGENERSFTLAIDFRFTNTSTNNTLISCYEEDGSEGFRLRMNNNPDIQWGDKNLNVGYMGYRDMVVLRHIKGDDKLYVYSSNGNNSNFSDTIIKSELTRNRSTNTEQTLTLGAIRFIADGGYDDYGSGYIYWAKIWYDDLGDTNAKALAAWSHEVMRVEFYGSERYRVADGTSRRCNASFIANNLLTDRLKAMNSTKTNVGGWDGCSMRTFINNRLQLAFPTVWRSMLKKVKINTTEGNKSHTILISDDYFYLPCYTELGGGGTPYVEEGNAISWFISNEYKVKYKGMIIPPDFTYYTDSNDPTTINYDIRPGDIWSKSGIFYIYASEEDILKYGLSTIDGVQCSSGYWWIANSAWWMRSPDIANNSFFRYVHRNGSSTNYSNDANTLFGVCPCFSI